MARPGLIDAYLAEVASQLGPRRAARILAEIEDHLREHAADVLAMGQVDPSDAERQAVEAFGDPHVIAKAFNDEGGAMPTTFTRWSGLAGMAAVPATVLSILVADAMTVEGEGDAVPVLLPFALVLLLLGMAGLIARSLGAFGRARGIAIGVLTVTGLAVGTVGYGLLGWISAGLLLAALALVCDVVLRQNVLPIPATVMFLTAVLVLSALSPTEVEKQSLPYYVGFAALVTGWVWLQYTLWSERPSRSLRTAA